MHNIRQTIQFTNRPADPKSIFNMHIPDHRPLLEAAGFDVASYDVTDRWRVYAEATNRGILDAVEELAAESGDTVEEERAAAEQAIVRYSTMSRRVFAVAIAR